jgi:hypothetical protein
MNFDVDWMTYFLSVGTALAALFGFFVVKRGHRPNIRVKLNPTWKDKEKGLLCVGMTISSKHDKFTLFSTKQLQCLEHKYPPDKTISEFVPFVKEDYETMYWKNGKQQGGTPGWREPADVFESTTKVEPQEEIYVERLVRCNPECIIQLGLQVESAKKPDSWTTTCFAPFKEKSQARQ